MRLYKLFFLSLIMALAVTCGGDERCVKGDKESGGCVDSECTVKSCAGGTCSTVETSDCGGAWDENCGNNSFSEPKDGLCKDWP